MDRSLLEKARKELNFMGRTYDYYDISILEQEGYDIRHLPYSIKILLESAVRQMDGHTITEEHVKNLAGWNKAKGDVPFKPARVILQDFTGVPAILDLAAMRAAVGEDASKIEMINPDVSVDLVIDHSVQVDSYASDDSLDENVRREFERNGERYQFLHWAKSAFRNFTVIPPATGIIHQVNLEYLAKVVITEKRHDRYTLYPDTLVGTDSHTTMINGLGVLGWGVGGIEAEAGMLGQPSYFPIPEVIGVRLMNKLQTGATATDLVLRITQLLRQKGVVGKFVEYFGDGVRSLTLADRATISNMAPEYGATCGFFPADEETLAYLKLTGRNKEQIELVREYLMKNDMFVLPESEDPIYTEVIELDLSTVEASLSGPKRPQDLIPLGRMKEAFREALTAPPGNNGYGLKGEDIQKSVGITLTDGRKSIMGMGSVAIAAITSCTNTSNPAVMLGAGLIAKNAVEKGLKVPAHVKTSLGPGSRVVTGYLEASGLQQYLNELGFQVVGYGCTTCIGNSGPLLPEISDAINDNDLLAASVLSGNRNFEGRIHSQIKANYLASPILVVAYALAGTIDIDLVNEPLGYNGNGEPVYLRDIWPSSEEISRLAAEYVTPGLFEQEYKTVYDRSELWNLIQTESSLLYEFDESSTYIRKPPFFDDMEKEPESIEPLTGLRVLACFGDSVTTDHISPAGAISKNTPAGRYLTEHGISPRDFNTYGARRGNHEVMMRGTFANIRIRNKLAPGTEGGYTTYQPTGEVMMIYDACMKYKEAGTGLVVLAGKDYGMGSSRDWAAKGPSLLGVKAVIAESFERIHRSNLVMMGVLPLQFIEGQSYESLGLTGEESLNIPIGDFVKPLDIIEVTAKKEDGNTIKFNTIVRFDSAVDADYYRHGGILKMVLRKML